MRRCLFACLILLLATPTLAQTRQGQASITVERAVGITEVSRMVFNATASGTAPAPPDETFLSTLKGAIASEPAVIQISGDPGRSYRINLPASISDAETNATITGFSVWSQNSGDITRSLTAKMDQDGRDTLRVRGVLTSVIFQDIDAAVPITVNYE